MSDLGFPLKDLARRRFQTGLTVAGLILCTATTVFLVALGESLGFEISLVTGERLTTGFSIIFSRFILVVNILNFLAGALITSFLVSLNMADRMQDLGVMRAAGCLTNVAFGYFLTELSIVILAGCGVGALLGILSHFISVVLLNALGFPIPQKPLNLWIILLIFLAFALFSHLFGVRPIRRALRVKPAEALSPLFQFGTASEAVGPAFSRFGFTFKIAYRSVTRRRSLTLQALICLSVVLTLTTTTVAGGIIANETTRSYVERAVGRDIILVGHQDMCEQYVKLLSRFFEAQQPMEQIDYLNPKYLISESLIWRLENNVSGVLTVDQRLILEAKVYELQGIIVDPKEPNKYIQIGDSRSAEAIIVGVNPKSLINDWLILGEKFNETDLDSVILGDTLALNTFNLPQKQGIKFLGKTYAIAGVCLDPLNNGEVVYAPLKALTGTKEKRCNILLLKVQSSNPSGVISQIEETISGTELRVVELNQVLNRHLGFLNSLWSTAMTLPLLSLVMATICLLSYLMLSIAGQRREFGIMRALGAKPKVIGKMVFTQALLLVLTSGAIGISTGALITSTFLIPESLISPYTLLLVTLGLTGTLTLLSITSLYPALKATKEPIAKVISQ